MKKNDLYKKISGVRSKIEGLKNYINETQELEQVIEKPIPHKKEEHPTKIEISSLTIFKLAFICLATFYFFQWLGSIADILLLMFAALVISSAFIPIVDYFQKYHIPRAITILIIYASFIASFAFLVSNIIPFLGEQLFHLSNSFSVEGTRSLVVETVKSLPYSERIIPHISETDVFTQMQNSIAQFSKSLLDFSGSFIGFLTSILGSVFSTGIILVLTFYMTLEKDAIGEFFQAITAGKHQNWLTSRSSEVVKKMGDWLRGQTFLSVSVGAFAYVGLLILGNPFALTLGFLTAILEFIPYIGPILAGLFAVLISLTISPLTALLTIALFAIIQFLENNLLVPLIMRRAVGLSPIVTIFAILVAVKLIGGAGIILAIPMAAAVSVIIKSITNRNV